MAEDARLGRPVGSFLRGESLELVSREGDVHGCNVLVELFDCSRTDDRRGHVWMCEQPGDADLDRRRVQFGCDCLDRLQHVEVLCGEIPLLETLRLGRTSRPRWQIFFAAVLAGQEASSEGAERHDPKIVVTGHVEILVLKVSVDKVVPELGHPEWFVSVLFGPFVRHRHLPSVVELPRRSAEVVDDPIGDELVERPEEFIDRCVVVPPVDVQQVEIVRPELVERLLDLPPDVFAAESAVVRAVADREVHLRRDDEIVAVTLGEPVANPALTLAGRLTVLARRVDEVAAVLCVGVQQGVGLFLIEDVPRVVLVAKARRSQRQFTHSRARVAELNAVQRHASLRTGYEQ